tara:strand:+ start:371 stop:1090 length:720 start_codon:yes stop_codon:yes gene_type:complete
MAKPKKSLSQNFLIDKNISKKIVDQTIVKGNEILEIGPGYGFLTDSILERNPKKVYLIEKDNNLKKKLIEKYKNNKIVNIIGDDILSTNLSDFKNLIIISNLPYNISSKIILYLFSYKNNIYEMIFMIQKEMSLKFDYKLPKMNKYKFLTRIVSNYNRCFDVSSKVFFPKPKVKSTIVKFKFNKKYIDLKKANYFSAKIFKNVRKKIYNNLDTNIENNLFSKRVNQLNIDELISIYDFF